MKYSGRAHYPPGNEEGAIICPVHGNYPALFLLIKSALLRMGFKPHMGTQISMMSLMDFIKPMMLP